jgi:hypothetical protein
VVASSFSERVTTVRWRDAASEWIGRELAAIGVTDIVAVDQPRVRPWSTQLVVDTTSGRFWFKANQPAFAFEPALQRALAAIAPDEIQAPAAIDEERGWMLTADHGPAVGDAELPSTGEWAELLREAARIQRRACAHREGLLATGLPDRSPASVPALFDRLSATLSAYPHGHPGHISERDLGLLGKARARVVLAAERVTASGVPSTWNHGDVHPWNAYRDATGLRLFDLGDGSWANAFEVLAVPRAWITRQGAWAGSAGPDVDWPTVRDAYLAEWALPVDADALWPDVELLHAVNRAQTWAAWLDDTTPDELDRYGRAAEEHLTSVLDILGMREGPGSD